jgi:oligoribonuclease
MCRILPKGAKINADTRLTEGERELKPPHSHYAHPMANELPHLVWIDCEMTGLSLETDALVEIAVLVTDSELNIIGEGIDLVIHATEGQLAEMNDFVRNMHTSSGLINEIPHGISIAEAEEQILTYLTSAGVVAGKSPLAGNSVSVDRNFIARDMKQLAEYLHYRTIDVSTIKELARRWYPKAYFAAPEKTGNHRALGDIKDSIEELKYYRASVFTQNKPNKAAKNNRFLNFGPWRVK